MGSRQNLELQIRLQSNYIFYLFNFKTKKLSYLILWNDGSTTWEEEK